jgi:hypothetical protein
MMNHHFRHAAFACFTLAILGLLQGASSADGVQYVKGASTCNSTTDCKCFQGGCDMPNCT